MEIYVKEYAWMWQRLGLSLAECRVYAYIYGLTNSTKTKQKGYKGSVRALAQMLGMDDGGVSRILRRLQDRQLIILANGVYTSADIISDSADSVSGSADTISDSADTISENADSVSSPVPPIKEINKEMERNNNIARETLATPNPQTLDSFEELLSAYSRANGNQQFHPETIHDARNLWDAMPAAKQRALLRALNAGTWNKPRLDWLLSDFQIPDPTNYNGRSFPMGAQMVIAIYNGIGGVYTKADAELYNMTIKKEIEP